MIPPPLPPGIQTTILSHLLPPNIPLPQQLLSKSLLQRHLYLPPSPDDIDAWLNPAPTPGIAELLERLTGTGWIVSGVTYAFDGEHYLARVKVVEDGRGEDEGEGVDVVFEFEAGSGAGGGEADQVNGGQGEGQEGRGWTYHSIHNGQTGNAISNLSWTTDIQNINTIEEHSGESEDVDGARLGEESHDAPAGYWAGFSPPTSPQLCHLVATSLARQGVPERLPLHLRDQRFRKQSRPSLHQRQPTRRAKGICLRRRDRSN